MGSKNSGRKKTGNKPMEFLTMMIPAELKESLKKEAQEKKVSLSWLIRQRLEVNQ